VISIPVVRDYGKFLLVDSVRLIQKSGEVVMVEGAVLLEHVGRGVEGSRGVEDGVLQPVVQVFRVLWALVVRSIEVVAVGVVVVADEGFGGVLLVVHQRQLEVRLNTFVE